MEQKVILLERYRDSLWQFYYAYARATYDFAFAADEGKFDQLKSEYEKAVWLALLDFRRAISGAIYLVPEAPYRHLLDLFDDLQKGSRVALDNANENAILSRGLA